MICVLHRVFPQSTTLFNKNDETARRRLGVDGWRLGRETKNLERINRHDLLLHGRLP
jgi:hypothetical protein